MAVRGTLIKCSDLSELWISNTSCSASSLTASSAEACPTKIQSGDESPHSKNQGTADTAHVNREVLECSDLSELWISNTSCSASPLTASSAEACLKKIQSGDESPQFKNQRFAVSLVDASQQHLNRYLKLLSDRSYDAKIAASSMFGTFSVPLSQQKNVLQLRNGSFSGFERKKLRVIQINMFCW